MPTTALSTLASALCALVPTPLPELLLFPHAAALLPLTEAHVRHRLASSPPCHSTIAMPPLIGRWFPPPPLVRACTHGPQCCPSLPCSASDRFPPLSRARPCCHAAPPCTPQHLATSSHAYCIVARATTLPCHASCPSLPTFPQSRKGARVRRVRAPPHAAPPPATTLCVALCHIPAVITHPAASAEEPPYDSTALPSHGSYHALRAAHPRRPAVHT